MANNLSPSIINVPHKSGQVPLITAVQEGRTPKVQQYGEGREEEKQHWLRGETKNEEDKQ